MNDLRIGSAELHTGLSENWDLLDYVLVCELAAETWVSKGLRNDKSVENMLLVLLLHLGCGYSLRETPHPAQLAELTAAAVWQRLWRVGSLGFGGRKGKSEEGRQC